MRVRRDRPDRELTDGPGKLCAALGVELDDDGIDLVGPSRISIVDDGVAAPVEPLVGPRVGISKAVDAPLRFRVPPSTGW